MLVIRRMKLIIKCLLKKYISFPESVTIEVGSVSADPVNVDIKKF